MTNYAINLNVITDEATQSLYKLDQEFVGTQNYMGLAYFWGQEYKHCLRQATVSQRPIKEIKKQLNKKQYGKNKNKLPN